MQVNFYLFDLQVRVTKFQEFSRQILKLLQEKLV